MSPPPHNASRPSLPELGTTRRRLVAGALFIAAVGAFLYLVLPRIAGLDETWERLGEGDPWWLAGALLFEALSFGGYIVLFQGVFGRDGPRIAWRASYQISMAGVVATRLLAAGGAGGIVLTVWALHRAGLDPHRLAARMTAFLVLLYSVFMAALVIGGLGLRTGVLSGPAPFGLTVVPAIFGATVIVLALAFTVVPSDLERRLGRVSSAEGRTARAARWLARVPAVIGEGVRDALALVRTRDVRLLGAPAWWAFDIAVLWACLHAFGDAPPVAVVVMAYFVGMLANLLPLPGGLGGVDGGMIGALIGFGVPGGLAIVGVLAYRGFAFWLPIVPGVVAYVGLLGTVQGWRRDRTPRGR